MSSTQTQPHDHKVLFYTEEGEFVAGVCQYVAQALAVNAVAVIIATRDHAELIDDHLAAVGFDPVELRRLGRLQSSDAAATLDRLLSVGHLEAGFDEHVGRRLRELVAVGEPVRVFGEMVAVAWERGDVPTALRLEQLWNELIDGLPGFQLLCAYKLADRSTAEALQVCRLHSELVGERSGPPRPVDRLEAIRVATIDLGRDVSAGREARARLGELLAEWGVAELAPAASIIVTELVTNALTHGDSSPVLTVSALPDAVRMSVVDGTHALPRVQDSSPTDLSGRGLAVVAALALRWGVRVADEGKEVWAELEASPSVAGGAA